MNLIKESALLGCQAIPPFVREATLVQLPQCWDGWDQPTGFPAAQSIFNVAAMAFYPRRRLESVPGGWAAQTLGVSYWTDRNSDRVPNIFGQSKVVVPQGAEYVAIAWIQPPDWSLINGPYPEDMFRIVWGLSV